MDVGSDFVPDFELLSPPTFALVILPGSILQIITQTKYSTIGDIEGMDNNRYLSKSRHVPDVMLQASQI